MAWTAQTTPTNALSQQFLDNMVFENRWKASPLLRKILSRVKKSVLVGDDMKTKLIQSNSFYLEPAHSTHAIGWAGTLKVAEYPYKKKTFGLPVELDQVALFDLDPINNPRDAVTIDRFFSGAMRKGDELMEWMLLGDGSGKVASCNADVAIADGVVTLDSKTPRIVFDKILTYGTYVVVGTISSGVVTPGTGSNSVYCQGYIIESSYTAKTITLALTYAGSAATNIDLAASSSNGVWIATPSTTTAQTTIVDSSYIISGLGLNSSSSTADSETTMTCMHGILKLNEYHSSSSYGLYYDGTTSFSGATEPTFQPVRIAGDGSKGLTTADLQAVLNDMNVDSDSEVMIATSNVIWTDWCEAYKDHSYTPATEGGAPNYTAGFRVNGTVVPVNATGYWDNQGIVHGLDLSTLHMIYTKSKTLRSANHPLQDVPAWGWRFQDLLHASSSYYAAVNQLVFRGNLVSDGRRNHNFVIDGLQTNYLSRAQA